MTTRARRDVDERSRDDDGHANDDDDAHARAIAANIVREMRAMSARARANDAPPRTSNANANANGTQGTTSARERASDGECASSTTQANARAKAQIVRMTQERDEARARARDAEAKLERATRKLKAFERELARVEAMGKSRSNNGRRRDVVSANECDRSGVPRVISYEYHASVAEAFERKVSSLVREIERMRASGERNEGLKRGDDDDVAANARASAEKDAGWSESRGTSSERESATVREGNPPPDASVTPARRRGRGNGDDNRALAPPPSSPLDDDDSPFSPTTSPLDALLRKLAPSPAARHRIALRDVDRNTTRR